MRDYEEKSYYEIQLDNKQLILVFLAAVTVCVLIFVLGVMIGKGQKEAEIAAAGRIEKTTTAPEPDNNTPQQALSDIASEARSSKKTTQAAKNEVEESTAETKVKPEPVPEKKQGKFAYEDLDQKDAKDVEQNEVKQPEKENVKADNNVAEAQPVAAEAPAEENDIPKSSGGTQYTVQIMATSSKPKAEQQLSVLRSKGYKPFLDETKTGDISVFKVRVGRFGDTQEAKELASRIKRDLRLETWVAVLE